MNYHYEDFQELKDVLQAHFEQVGDLFWKMRTGRREKDWTLHEALAHLVAIAEALNIAAEAAVKGEPGALTDIVTKREDLRTLNDTEIAKRTQKLPQALLTDLLSQLNRAEATIRDISTPDSEAKTLLGVYNRPARAIDFLDWQISHPVAVHGAQVTRPMNDKPLWERFSADFVHRLLDRYTRQFSYVYWPEFGPKETRVMNFIVEGDYGGEWQLMTSADGGSVQQGRASNADYEIIYDSPGTYFSVYTFHIPMKDALKSGMMRVNGDIHEVFGLLRLYTPSPPSRKFE